MSATIFAKADPFGKATIAYEVHGDILKKYVAMGGDRSKLGCPVTDKLWTADRTCRFSTFTSGVIYCNSRTGACVLNGEIYKKWVAVGGADGVMGYPVSDVSTIDILNSELLSISPYIMLRLVIYLRYWVIFQLLIPFCEGDSDSWWSDSLQFVLAWWSYILHSNSWGILDFRRYLQEMDGHGW